MALTNNLRTVVDLPVFEWMRFSPQQAFTGEMLRTMGNRYIYSNTSSSGYKYDTWYDTWLVANFAPISGAHGAFYNKTIGFFGRAVSGGANTITMGALNGQALAGNVIEIIAGTGVGQKRTILSVANPVIAEYGNTTSVPTATSIADTSKAWKVNQWRGYQVRFITAQPYDFVQTVLNNSPTVLTFQDSYQGIQYPYGGYALPFSAVSGTYQIESNVVTVDSNWTVQPDSTSMFVVRSGSMMIANGLTLMDYVLVNNRKMTRETVNAGAISINANGDFPNLVGFDDDVIFDSGTASAGAAYTLTDSTKAWATDAHSNSMVRITGGTGVGQKRTILGNLGTILTVMKAWDTNPDATSTYEILNDIDKAYTAYGSPFFYQYSMASDMVVPSRQYDWGITRQMSARVGNTEPLPVTSITKSTTSVTVLSPTPTVAGTGYGIDNILTITGGTTVCTARVTAVDSVGGVTAVEIETPGAGYTTGTGKATTVVPAGGTGCTLNITTVGDTAEVTTAINHNFRKGDTVVIAGANEAPYNGSQTILGTNLLTTFQYAVAGSPATPATFTAQSTTAIVDASKNWVVNEHKGKIVFFHNTSNLGSGYISSNTATVLTIGGVLATYPPINAQKYTIVDQANFGQYVSIGGKKGGGVKGWATSGAATSLTDSSKNWPTNWWKNRLVRVVAGTGFGNEMAITSNTATTLTYSAPGFTPDTTTRYHIKDHFGQITSYTATNIGNDTTQNFDPGVIGRYGKSMFSTFSSSFQIEATISASTATSITCACFGGADTPKNVYCIPEAVVNPASVPSYYFIPLSSSDSTINRRYIYSVKGGTNGFQRYNIASETVEPLSVEPAAEAIAQGSMFAYDGGDRVYYTIGVTGRIFYWDIVKGVIHNAGTVPYGMGTVVTGNKMDIMTTSDGLKYLYIKRHNGQEVWRVLLAY